MSTIAVEVDDFQSTRTAGSEQSGSCRESITHPYSVFLEDTIFPRCHLVANPERGYETYGRSLSMLGHGIALWNPIGSFDSSRKKKHLKTGINAGDVGYLGQRGQFEYYFNIFASATDDVQIDCPPDFVPLGHPGPKNIVKNETHFPPGTTFVSKGVTETRISTSPLDIEFAVNARECGILILPDGASREDLTVTDDVRKYVHENALAWYRHINRYSDAQCANGNLYIITGCDKSLTFTNATSSPLKSQSFRYQNGEWKENNDLLATSSYGPEYDCMSTVFIRGMQVALSASSWIKYIFEDDLPSKLFFYYMPRVPITGPQAKWQTLRERYGNYMERRCNGDAKNVPFHPLGVVLKLLIKEFPKADVAIAEDKQWCPFVDNSDGSILEICRILRKVLEEHEALEENGLVTLFPRRRSSQGTLSRPVHPLLRAFKRTGIQDQRQAQPGRVPLARRLAEIFPGEGLPESTLTDYCPRR